MLELTVFTRKAQQQYQQAKEKTSGPAERSTDIVWPEELESSEQS